MATSETAICNDALVEIGAARIASLSEDSATARICKEQFPIIRDELIAGHPWNFALKRANLAASTTAPVNKYARAFAIPSDCLRILEMYQGEETDWQVEGGYIVTDSSSMEILYISRVLEVGKYPPHVSRALALKLAANIIYALVQSVSLKEMIEKKAEFVLAQARSFDAQVGAPRQPYAKTWLNSRY